MMRSRLSVGVAAVAVLAVGVPALAAGALVNFVAQGGEETGFAPQGMPKTYPTASAFDRPLPAKERKRDVARLRREGFKGAVTQNMSYTANPKNGAGLSLVIGLKSAGAARAELKSQFAGDVASQGKGVRIQRFTVPGVPGSKGFTATDKKHGGGAANVLFTEGSCMLLVGDAFGGSPQQRIAPVSAAAAAIYKRTGGTCP
jgi:hypothetical protein